MAKIQQLPATRTILLQKEVNRINFSTFFLAFLSSFGWIDTIGEAKEGTLNLFSSWVCDYIDVVLVVFHKHIRLENLLF